MNMLLTSLAAIYQGTIPILPYNHSHAHQLSRMHLRYVIIGELTHWTSQLIRYLSDPYTITDPGTPQDKYNAGGTTILDLDKKRPRPRNEHNR